MSSDNISNDTPLTAFRSAPEDAAMRIEEAKWDNEGGQMRSSAGHVMHVPGVSLPYTVVVTRPRGRAFQRSFKTMRQAEGFIRRNGPISAPVLSKLYDRPASIG